MKSGSIAERPPSQHLVLLNSCLEFPFCLVNTLFRCLLSGYGINKEGRGRWSSYSCSRLLSNNLIKLTCRPPMKQFQQSHASMLGWDGGILCPSQDLPRNISAGGPLVQSHIWTPAKNSQAVVTQSAASSYTPDCKQTASCTLKQQIIRKNGYKKWSMKYLFDLNIWE